MQLKVNGDDHQFEKVSTVQDLLDELTLEGRLAVEVNNSIVPRSQYTAHKLHSGDRIEIVRAIGGG